jgi:hypothetical protein
MIHQRFPRFILFLLFLFAFIVPLGFVIMALWNNILVDLLHLPLINFWQALGLFALSRILFGGFPGKSWGRHRGQRRDLEEMRSKWFNMSPEEKKQFKQNLRDRFGRGPATASPEPPVTE